MPIYKLIDDNCKTRVKTVLLLDRKTEALLIFARTALERYFAKIDEVAFKATVGSDSDTRYVYDTLRKMLVNLQESVVNVDYFMLLMQGSEIYPQLKELAKHEDSLIRYYDVMAGEVAKFYKTKPAYLPEFLVICVLSHWVLENEKSTNLYPFLKDIDFLELMSKFESNREYFEKDEECTINEIHELSSIIIQRLQNYKYKVNKTRVSKTRKKK